MSAPATSPEGTAVVDLAAERKRRLARREARKPFAEKVERAKRSILRRAGLAFVLDPKSLDPRAIEA